MASRIVGRLQRIWCAVRGHVGRELGWPGLWASRHFSCRCGVAGSQSVGDPKTTSSDQRAESDTVEEAPRPGPACLACGGAWGTCPHDEFHVIAAFRVQNAELVKALEFIARPPAIITNPTDRLRDVQFAARAALTAARGGG